MATPEGTLRPAWVSTDLLEFFAHPNTAQEVLTQSGLGVLRFNGRPAKEAHLVDQLGNGDHLIRVTFHTKD